jgi:hypothetical protein
VNAYSMSYSCYAAFCRWGMQLSTTRFMCLV